MNIDKDTTSIILQYLNSKEIYNFAKTSKINNKNVIKYKYIYYESSIRDNYGHILIDILKDTNVNYRINLKDLYNKYKYNSYKNNIDIIKLFFEYLENKTTFKWNNNFFIYFYNIFYYLTINQYKSSLLQLRNNFLENNNINKDDNRFEFIMGISRIIDRDFYN